MIVKVWYRGTEREFSGNIHPALYELIGKAQVEAMLVFVAAGNCFSVYNSMMARLFIYAPIILKKYHGEMNTQLKVKYV